jgi:MscS family membrane protein
MEIVLDDLHDDIITSEVVFRAYRRIMSMLDFSLALPLIDSVPNLAEVRSEKERTTKSTSGTVGQIRWRYPNTTIEIVEIMEGSQ